VDLYIHSPIRLHGAVPKGLSTGTTLPFLPTPNLADLVFWGGVSPLGTSPLIGLLYQPRMIDDDDDDDDE
jgi:hypothetical protein